MDNKINHACWVSKRHTLFLFSWGLMHLSTKIEKKWMWHKWFQCNFTNLSRGDRKTLKNWFLSFKSLLQIWENWKVLVTFHNTCTCLQVYGTHPGMCNVDGWWMCITDSSGLLDNQFYDLPKSIHDSLFVFSIRHIQRLMSSCFCHCSTVQWKVESVCFFYWGNLCVRQ